MYVVDTSIFNVGQDVNKLQKTTDNTGLVQQYFETYNLCINPTKTHIFFQTKQCREESKLKILVRKTGKVN